MQVGLRSGILATVGSCLLATGCGAQANRTAFGQARADQLPTSSEIRDLENLIKLPTETPISNYARFYWVSPSDQTQVLRTCEFGEVTPEEGPFLRAVYVHRRLGFSPGVHVRKMPAHAICDGGCSVIDVALSLKTRRIVEASCHSRG